MPSRHRMRRSAALPALGRRQCAWRPVFVASARRLRIALEIRVVRYATRFRMVACSATPARTAQDWPPHRCATSRCICAFPAWGWRRAHAAQRLRRQRATRTTRARVRLRRARPQRPHAAMTPPTPARSAEALRIARTFSPRLSVATAPACSASIAATSQSTKDATPPPTDACPSHLAARDAASHVFATRNACPACFVCR